MKRNKKGFTIVELVIVIAVVGILTGILIPVIVNLTAKANEASDDALVTNLNKQLAIAEQEPGYETTTYQKVIDIVDDAGYKIPNLVSKSGEDLFWNQRSNRFYLGNKLDNQYPAYTYWTIKDALDGDEEYSVYAGLNFEATSVNNLKAGFDVGSNAHIKEVNYVGADAKQDGVTFRFLKDEFNADFKNNNNHQDEVKVYGNPNAVNSEKSGQQSLYIYEDIASLEVKEGHVVVAPGVKIGSLIFKATSTNTFDKIVVEIPDVNAQVDNIYRSGVSTSLDPGTKVEVATIKTTEKSETYFLEGNGTIEDSKLLVSPTGDVEDAVAVTEETASDAAKAIANAKDPDTGDVVDTGKTDQEIIDVKDETQAEKQAEVVEKKAEEEGTDFNEYAVRIGTVGYMSFKDAYNAAKEGDTISLLKDLNLTASNLYTSNRYFLNKSLTIDGCGNSIAVAQRGFGLHAKAFTFKNVTITNSSSGARCIDARPNHGGSGVYVDEINLYKVTLSTHNAPSGYTQPLTIGGNTSDNIDPETNLPKHIKVNITDSTIITKNDSSAYYSIIAFNPIDLTINNSSLKGWANIYLKPSDGSYGSRGSNVVLNNCTLSSNNKYNGTSNSFGLIVFEDPYSYFYENERFNVTLNDCEVHVKGNSDQEQGLFLVKSYTGAVLNILGQNTIYFEGSYSENAVACVELKPDNLEENVANGTVIVCSNIEATGIADFLDSQTQELRDNGDGTYTVVAKVLQA